MGKGGQKVVDVVIKESPVPVSQKEVVKVYPMKLNHLNTEDLKKWAKAYGVNSESDREELLALLVRIRLMNYEIIDSYFTYMISCIYINRCTYLHVYLYIYI
jgi:hypothetical protein